jgi:FkbM family methyltransferase
MTRPPSADLAYRFHVLEKALLTLRFVWRFPPTRGAWPKYEYLKPWLCALQPATVIDIGANRGQFLYLARRLWPRARIVGVEPVAALCDRLRTGSAGDPLVSLHCCAAGAADGTATFYRTRNDQNGSLLAPSARFGEDRTGDGLVGTETVAVRTASALLGDAPGPILAKIDVQGAELAALEGFGPRLDDVAAIIVESPFERAYDGASTFDDVYRFLTARGFAYEGALGTLIARRTGRIRQEDSVYRRPDALA